MVDLVPFNELIDISLLWLFSAGHGHSDSREARVRMHQQSSAADHDAKPGEILYIKCPAVRVKRRKICFNIWMKLILKNRTVICPILLVQHTVEVLNLLSDDVETDDAGPGENLKLRLKGIEEEEILPGFILCSPDNICHSGRTFDAQVKTAATATQLLWVCLHA